MAIPRDIDPQAVRLLLEADCPWDDRKKAFVEARRPERESPTNYRRRLLRSIGYGELRDHGLAGTVSSAKRDKGLAWLRRLIGVNE